jgi:serine protease Do
MKSWVIKITAILTVLLVAGAIFVLVTGTTFQQTPSAANAATNQTLVDETTITNIYATASPAVVEIIVTSQSSGYRSYSTEGQGSGFVIDKNGNILTNNHVVDGATSVQVVFSNGNSVSANVLGKDAADDLAIVKVDASSVAGITPLTLADSSTVIPGQLAIAIGSPYGLTNSITTGIISGLNRSVDGDSSSLTGMIQTDATIQPGNSGGPLLNSSGLVIGINTAIEGDGTGIGFAVPSSVALQVISDLEANKQIEKPWIGISGQALSQSTAEELGLSINQGIYVIEVVSSSPAETAGLKGAGTNQNGNPGTGGDIISAVDGKTVNNVTDLQSYLKTKRVGDTVILTVIRSGSTISISVTLAAQTATTTSDTPTTPDFPNSQIPGYTWPWRNR